MSKCRLLKSHVCSETVTVAEVIQELQKYASHLPVAFVWEGQIRPVVFEAFEVMQETDKVHGPILLLDADT